MATSGHESEVINVGGLKAALQDLNNGQQKCISLASIPTDTTLTYSVTDPVTSQAVTKRFKVGDRVVVEDQEHGDEEYDYLVVYTLLKLYKVGNVDKALWAPGGAGGGGAVTGKIKVSIAAYVNDIAASAALLGNVTVTLTNTTDGGTPQTATWNGTDITFSKLTPLKGYRVAIEDKTGWLRNKAYEDIASLGIGEEKSVSFSYSADEYSCSVSGTADGRIVVGGTEYANGATFRVAKGTSITATAKTVANYVTPTPAISGKAITATYVAYGVLTVVTSSNQDEQGAPDATIAAVSPTIKVGDAAAVTYTSPMPIAPDASVEVEWPAVTGYTAPSKQTFTMPSTDTSKSGEYATEILTVAVTQEDGQDADISGATVTVTDQTASAAVTAGQDGKYRIPGGHTYLVTVSDVQGYITPTHTAEVACDNGRRTNTVTMTYVYNPITYAYIKIDQTKSNDQQMITVSETENGTAQVLNSETGRHANAALQALRDASHLYMGKAANGTMALRQLKDDDGTKYADGGVENNLPIHMAVERGATDIVAIYLDAIGRFDREKELSIAKDTNLIFIQNRWDPGNFLVFDKKNTDKLIQLGYQDTMKAFGVYDGSRYCFIKGDMDKRQINGADFAAHIFELNPMILYSKDRLLEDLKSEIKRVKEEFKGLFSVGKKVIKNRTLDFQGVRDVVENLISLAGNTVGAPGANLKQTGETIKSYNRKVLTITIAHDLRENKENSIFLNRYPLRLLKEEVQAARFIEKNNLL